jgi:hypothetical protein
VQADALNVARLIVGRVDDDMSRLAAMLEAASDRIAVRAAVTSPGPDRLKALQAAIPPGYGDILVGPPASDTLGPGPISIAATPPRVRADGDRRELVISRPVPGGDGRPLHAPGGGGRARLKVSVRGA